MRILNELKKRGIDVIQTDHLFRGLHKTEKGFVVTRVKSKADEGIYFLDDGKGKVFPCNDQTNYIVSGTEYEGKIKTIQQAKQLAEEGKIFSFKTPDLYSEYYDFKNNKDLECCFKYGYSYQSRKYIESTMEEIGLVKYTDVNNGSMNEEGEPTSFTIAETYEIFMNAVTEVGKIEDLWIAQTCVQISIDDFAVVKMYFSHMPSETDLQTAFAIRSFECEPIEVFRCMECGHMVNWLELDGNINVKYRMAEEKYCGC